MLDVYRPTTNPSACDKLADLYIMGYRTEVKTAAEFAACGITSDGSNTAAYNRAHRVLYVTQDVFNKISEAIHG